MEELNDYPPVYEEKKRGFFQRISKILKVVTIGFLVLLLLIPMNMIRGLINERHDTETTAVWEVSDKWSGKQTIVGPYLNFDYGIMRDSEGKQIVTKGAKNLTLLPEELSIDAQLITDKLNRGIYEVNVYQSILTLKGNFSPNDLKKQGINIDKINFENATLCLGISDMRGISEQIKVVLGDSVYNFEPGLNGKMLASSGVNKVIDIEELRNKVVPYTIEIKLKGSQGMFFAPLGKTTKIAMKGNWGTPSFDGRFLPEKREITKEGFTAQWQVLNLNRSFSQAFISNDAVEEVEESLFGVNLKVPVDQYQQSTRTAKYAILIILLTFIVIFFVEIMDKKSIHALQYLLIGLALCLFYTLLISISEQTSFGMAYLISSVLTITLIGLYIRGIMKKVKPALIMIGLLSVLYAYIYVLTQLETLALLAGSLGLFVILAMLMYFSKKIDWFGE
ncbi:cell envelope integrity protein CreD [Bacteroides sp. 224]|uniref:cell envelope integrity protein CreD n=1 Tax=Bacteroides sp. 224 TaxID=2302936 RepID=UPI0013D0B684|nr:cell envelope integrity protein CreD [Bacteroides sp. 224]NDV65258.1 cell envelope integrity protein CreD [Bacteroides sp. 224]